MQHTVNQIAKLTGLSADTLRYYEKEGMISPKRCENGYRYYDENDMVALKYIVVMKYARFTLSEMRSMEELQTRERGTQCNEIAKHFLSTKANELRQAIHNYQKIVMLLEELLPMVERADTFNANKTRITEFIEQIFDDITNKETR